MKSANTFHISVSMNRKGTNVRRTEFLYWEARHWFTVNTCRRDKRALKLERRRLLRRGWRQQILQFWETEDEA